MAANTDITQKIKVTLRERVYSSTESQATLLSWPSNGINYWTLRVSEWLIPIVTGLLNSMANITSDSRLKLLKAIFSTFPNVMDLSI